jgi:plastocyanin
MRVRTRFLIATTTLVAVLGGFAALLPLLARPAEPREIVVVARQMGFYMGQVATVNPTIQVAPGEKVRITLVSEDPGFDHDFAVTAWQIGTSILHGEGRTSVVFDAPDTPGVATYICSRHASMMKGTIEVSGSPSDRTSGR